MKSTFASLMLLLVHTLIGVPLSAHVMSGAASAEANTAGGSSDGAALASGAGDIDRLMVAAASAAQAALTFGSAADAVIPAVRNLATPLPGNRYFDLPQNWGSGDRLALDEGKP